jgi:hypothetical protein
MRNPRLNKLREYRKALRGAKGYISLWKLFDHIHPECEKDPRWWHPDWRTWLDQVDNIREDWFREITHEPVSFHYGGGNAPAHFRRDVNRSNRNKEKQAIRDAASNNVDWEDFTLPRPRRNVNWLWW